MNRKHGLESEDGRPLQSPGVLVAYALAWAGGCVAYVPLLTALLPQRMTALAETSDVRWLGIAATVGAVTASLSNILWGWMSDRVDHRLRFTAAGLILFAITSALIAISETPFELVAAVALWQIALNLVLAPLAAFAADVVPDAQKGTLGGMLAAGPGIAATSLLAISLLPDRFGGQLAAIVLITVAAFLPLFITSRRALAPSPVTSDRPALRRSRATLIQLWLARLTVQAAEGLLFLFLYYALRRLSGGTLSLRLYAMTAASAQLIAIPVAMTVGRWSDRSGRRRGPLLAMIALIALGLASMSVAGSWVEAGAGYVIFLIGSNSFLSLHSTFAMQQLRDPRHYGRDLGLFNLTNTLPALVTPLIAVGVIGAIGYPGLLACLAVVMIVPAVLVARMKFA